MTRSPLAGILGLIFTAHGIAQALPATATNNGAATTITASFPAASLADDAFPLFLLPEGQTIAGRRRLLVLPLDSLIPDHEGNPQEIDAIVVAISKAMAYQAAQSGQTPPAFVDGVRLKVQQKLTDEYRGAVATFGAVVKRTATPAEVAAGIPDAP